MADDELMNNMNKPVQGYTFNKAIADELQHGDGFLRMYLGHDGIEQATYCYYHQRSIENVQREQQTNLHSTNIVKENYVNDEGHTHCEGGFNWFRAAYDALCYMSCVQFQTNQICQITWPNCLDLQQFDRCKSANSCSSYYDSQYHNLFIMNKIERGTLQSNFDIYNDIPANEKVKANDLITSQNSIREYALSNQNKHDNHASTLPNKYPPENTMTLLQSSENDKSSIFIDGCGSSIFPITSLNGYRERFIEKVIVFGDNSIRDLVFASPISSGYYKHNIPKVKILENGLLCDASSYFIDFISSLSNTRLLILHFGHVDTNLYQIDSEDILIQYQKLIETVKDKLSSKCHIFVNGISTRSNLTNQQTPQHEPKAIVKAVNVQLQAMLENMDEVSFNDLSKLDLKCVVYASKGSLPVLNCFRPSDTAKLKSNLITLIKQFQPPTRCRHDQRQK